MTRFSTVPVDRTVNHVRLLLKIIQLNKVRTYDYKV